MLTLNHVFYRYARHLPDVLRDVNYTFARGRFYAIVGESGAGKSTLISLLAGLDSPTAGEVLFDGQDLRRMKPAEYRVKHVGLVFQGYNLLLRQSALDNVIVPLYLAGLPTIEQKSVPPNCLNQWASSLKSKNVPFCSFPAESNSASPSPARLQTILTSSSPMNPLEILMTAMPHRSSISCAARPSVRHAASSWSPTIANSPHKQM